MSIPARRPAKNSVTTGRTTAHTRTIGMNACSNQALTPTEMSPFNPISTAGGDNDLVRTIA